MDAAGPANRFGRSAAEDLSGRVFCFSRIVFLPREEELIEAIGRLGEFLATYRQ